MVQVLDFACTNGKAAVHCHAGLGRTGVLIACYIIFAERVSANQAIRQVRKARPPSIQTREQINCVKDFAAYIRPMWVIFSPPEHNVTLNHFLQRQMKILHGEERQKLRCIPKIVFIVLTRLLQISNIDFDLTPCVKVKFSLGKRPLQPSVPHVVTTPVTTHTTDTNSAGEEPWDLCPGTTTSEPSANHTTTTKMTTDIPLLSEEDLFCLQRQNTDFPLVKKSSISDVVPVPSDHDITSFSMIRKSSSLPNVSFISAGQDAVSYLLMLVAGKMNSTKMRCNYTESQPQPNPP